jgi:hypothetical protein
LVEGLVVEARDADDTAIDLAGEWHENELLGSEPEQILLVELRLLTGQDVRAAFVVEQVRPLLGHEAVGAYESAGGFAVTRRKDERNLGFERLAKLCRKELA